MRFTQMNSAFYAVALRIPLGTVSSLQIDSAPSVVRSGETIEVNYSPRDDTPTWLQISATNPSMTWTLNEWKSNGTSTNGTISYIVPNYLIPADSTYSVYYRFEVLQGDKISTNDKQSTGISIAVHNFTLEATPTTSPSHIFPTDIPLATDVPLTTHVPLATCACSTAAANGATHPGTKADNAGAMGKRGAGAFLGGIMLALGALGV